MKLTIDVPDNVQGITLALLGISENDENGKLDFTMYSQNYVGFKEGDTLKYTGKLIGIPSGEDSSIESK